MFKSHHNYFIRDIHQKLIGVCWLFLMSLLTACSSFPSPSSSDHQPSSTAQVEQPEKGPYEAGVMDEASVVSYVAPEDPLRYINEPIFSFNDLAYTYVLSPLASGYKKIVPESIANAITNFFYNLREPLYALNHLLQGNFAESWVSIKRVVVNTTVGLVGFFDAADDLMAIERNKTTFGNTLESYGVGHGAYLVLPLLGPSDFRDAGSLTFNYFAHPLNFINDESAAQQLLILDAAQSQVPVLSNYPQVMGDVDNKYEFVRNLYMQNLQRDGNAKRQETFTPKNQEE